MIEDDLLEKMKDKLPHLYSVYKKCGNDQKIKIISYSLLCSWCDDEKITENEFNLAIDDCEVDCSQIIKELGGNSPLDDFEGELPDNFPNFKTHSQYEILPSQPETENIAENTCY